jgi:addiction module HigA family antidote
MSTKLLDPIHPGEILAEEFMRPLGLSANALARALSVPVTRISEILRGRRGVSADSALRLARFLGTSAELWLSLQTEYDLRVARRMAGAGAQPTSDARSVAPAIPDPSHRRRHRRRSRVPPGDQA